MVPEAEAGAGATEPPSSSSKRRIEETPEDRLWEWVVNGEGQTCSTWDEVEFRGVARALQVKAPNRAGGVWNLLCPLEGCDVWKGDSENDLRHHVLGKSKEEALMTEEELQNHRAMMHANRKTTRQYDKLWIVRENMRHRRNLILMGYKVPAINAEEQALLEERRPTWERNEAEEHEEWDKKWDVPLPLLEKLQKFLPPLRLTPRGINPPLQGEQENQKPEEPVSHRDWLCADISCEYNHRRVDRSCTECPACEGPRPAESAVLTILGGPSLLWLEDLPDPRLQFAEILETWTRREDPQNRRKGDTVPPQVPHIELQQMSLPFEMPCMQLAPVICFV